MFAINVVASLERLSLMLGPSEADDRRGTSEKRGAAAPPPSFSGGGKWEAMRDEMAGFYEVRVQGGGMNHRLFCLLERDATDLGGSSIVCVGGFSKPPRTAAHPREYKKVRLYGAEFQKHRTVLE